MIFDLGGTLMWWPDWVDGAAAKWTAGHARVVATRPGAWPAVEPFVAAMRAAELEHWAGVEGPEHTTGDPAALVRSGFARLGLQGDDADALAVVDGYAEAVSGWCRIFDDSAATLRELRERGLRLGLLSNTWWAAAWHNADLATAGLDAFFDATLYTSELERSKPHPSVFREAARRLGVAPEECVMVGDRMIDDVSGAQSAGMRGIWKRNTETPVREDIHPDAVVDRVGEVPTVVASWAAVSRSAP
ncbi:MAG: hypothetical protein NVSMB8_06950 [Candidatus Limnocylindrales bacterium]